MKNFSIYIKSIIIVLMVSALFSFLLTYFYPKIVSNNNLFFEMTNINFWIRFMLLFSFVFFISVHFVFNLNSLYKWLYKKRYFISLGIVVFAVIFELNNSSIDLWNFLNTNTSQEKSYIILGKARTVRFDEWSIYTPMLLSQNPEYKYFSDSLRGGNTDVFMIYGQPIKNIVSIFRPFLLGFLFLGSAKGLSFFWIIRLILLFLISFEFFMLMSNKNKIVSLIGTFLIVFAPAVQWWWTPSGIVEIIIFGEILVLLFDNYLKQKNFTRRSIIIFLMIVFVGCYLFVLYPAWQLPTAYILIVICLWIVMEKYNDYKFDKKDILPISIFSVLFFVTLCYIYSKSKGTIDLITNTVYPGSRFETGGSRYTEYSIGCDSFIHVFRYWGNIFLSFTSNNLITQQCNFATFFDLFPMGLVVSFIVLFKDKIKDKLLIMLLMVYLFFTVWCVIGFPKSLAQVTMMKVSPVYRTFIILGFLNVLIFIRSLSLFKSGLNKVYSFFISFVLVITIVISNMYIYKDYFNVSKIIIVSVLSFSLFYLILRNKINKLFMFLIMLIMISSGLFVNPIQKGIAVVKDSELSKVIKKIDTQEKGLWIVENFNFFAINFPIMQGVKTLNSTNTYPNFDMLNILDNDKKYSNVYNRYANILVKFIHENNIMDKFVLLSKDCFQINMTVNDILKLNINYVLTNRNLEELNDDRINFDQLYFGKAKQFNIYIYRIKRF